MIVAMNIENFNPTLEGGAYKKRAIRTNDNDNFGPYMVENLHAKIMRVRKLTYFFFFFFVIGPILFLLPYKF